MVRVVSRGDFGCLEGRVELMAKDPKEMSIEEILAACRQADSEGASRLGPLPA